MSDNHFDQFIRAKLQNHSAPVPAGLWNKVNPAKKDDRRKGLILPRKFRFGLLLLAALLFLGSLTAYLINNGNNASGITANTSQVVAAQANTGNQTQNNSTPNNKTNTAVIAPENQPANETNPDAIDANPHNKNTIATTTAASQPKNNIQTTNTTGQVTKPLASHQNIQEPLTGESSYTANNSKTRNNSSNNGIAPAGIITLSSGKPQQPFISKNPWSLSSNDRTMAVSANTVDDDNASINDNITLPLSGQPFTGYAAGNLGAMDLKTIGSNAGAHAKTFKSVIICPTDKRGNTDWFAEVYLSPDLAFKQFENRTATPQYLVKKDSSERMQVGYSAGIRLVKPITENLLVKSGLQYTQINEKFTYRTENEVRTTTVISVRTIVRAPGDTITVTDTSTVQQFGYKTNSIKNRYRSIDVPVIVGYQFGNDNLKFGINAGVIFNLSSWYQGVILDTSLTAVPITKGSNTLYKNNIGMGLYAGFSVLKKIGENTQLFFEPYFRYNLSNITNNNASYNQKFSLGGLSIGLRYNLKRQ